VLGDGTLEGNEEALATFSDALIINQLRHAVRSQGRMSQQRVPFSVRDEALGGLRDWWADRLDWWGFNQLCGNVGPAAASITLTTSDTRWTGLQATIAPDANHYTNSVATANDTGLGSTNTFNLSLIDKAVERAKTLTPAIRPIRVGGKKFYVAWLHPYQVTDLRTATSTGQWLDIQKAAMTGGLVDENPIFDGSLGVYNGVILHEDYRVTQGYNPSGNTAITTVRRAVFAGAQSAMIAFGRDNSVNKFTWVEELFDYENQLGVSAGLIAGLKKTVFNSADFATIVLSSYAAQH
jgi:N4-gp56 family major capsid protein